MFYFPLMTMSAKQDDAEQLSAQEAITNFGNKVIKTGRITQEDVDNLYLTLNSNGRVREPEIIVQVLDENPTKKTSSATIEIDGKAYHILYMTQIQAELDQNGVVNLKEGDIVTARAVTVDDSIYDQLVNWAYKATGKKANTVEFVGMTTKAAN